LKIGNKWKKPIALFTVLFTLFAWRQIVLLTMDNFLGISIEYKEAILAFGIYYLSVTLFIIIGSISFERIKENFYIPVWVLLAMISSMTLLLFGVNKPETKALYLLLAGASVGIGIPSCLAFFADNTSTENRGHTGAIIFFFTSLTFVVLAIMANMLRTQNFMLFSFFWALLSLMLVLIVRVKKKPTEKSKVDLRSVISNKQFLLYFIPWVVFCFIDAFEAPILQHFVAENFGNNFIDFLLLIETSVTAFVILIAGFLIDYYGRRKILLYGFITLGIAHAIIGIDPRNIFSWYLYALIDGLALGVFIVTFVFTVWGDLSPRGSREKYYAIGSLPFFVIVYVQKIIAPYILQIPISAAFSFASFFLFLAVWPLFNAPETLPEKKIKERELKKYIEKAKKVKEKYD
jgi:MFS family permease